MVSWTPPQSDLNITSYEVQSRPNNTAEWKTVTVTGQLTQRAHTLENLTVGTEYSVRVRAVSDAGEGEWSEISVATTSDCELTYSIGTYMLSCSLMLQSVYVLYIRTFVGM